MKSIRILFFCGLALAASLYFAHAQTSDDDLATMIQAIELTPPVPASSLPDGGMAGTFWSAQNPNFPPYPGDILGLDCWPLGDGTYVLDDTNVDYPALAAEAAAAKPSVSRVSSSGDGFEPMFSLISGSGGTPVYLTNLVETLTNGTATTTFSIEGGTNGFTYDIYSATNLTDSPIYSQWNWLGQGFTTNSYTFSNQPPDYAFYILAIPRHTMVVAWGDDSDGQCDVPPGLTNAIDVAGGYNFSLALKADGTVVAWGDNTYGETTVPAGLTNVTSLAAGGAHVLALLKNGTVVAWGSNENGQTNVPAGLTNVTAIAAGDACSFALRNNGTVVAWGYNGYGQTNVPALGPVTQVAGGVVQGVALLTNSTVAMWAATDFSDPAYNWNITNAPAGLSNVVSIAAGAFHTLALQADGTVTAWGAGGTNTGLNNYGQSIVPMGLSNVVVVAGGYLYSVALQADGTVMGWGDDEYGETDVPDGLTGVKAISAGGFHGLAVRSGQLTPVILEEPGDQYAPAGETVTFSSEGEGLYGVTYQWQTDGVDITGATNATLTLTNVQSAQLGTYDVVMTDKGGMGSIVSSNANFYLVPAPVVNSETLPTNQFVFSQSSLTLNVSASAPYQTDGFPISYQWQLDGTNILGATVSNYTFTAVSSGTYSVTVSSAAGSVTVIWQVTVLTPGNVWAWGDNEYGEDDVPLGITNISAIAAGEYHAVAVEDNGSVIQWGYNWGSIPADLTNAVAVAAGYEHSIALRSDGTVETWGETNSYGNRVPPGIAGVKAVAAGWYDNVVLLTNSTVTAWGLNADDLGWGDLTNIPTGLTNVTAISAESYHALALCGNGTVVAWGDDQEGESDVPTGLSNVVAVAAGGQHSLALLSNGTVTAWGMDDSGQCDVPVGLSNVMAIAAGWEHSVALLNNGTVVSWGDNSDGQTNTPALNQVKLIAAGGDFTIADIFSKMVMYPVDVTKDLLLIYNTNSVGSTTVENYYVQHRPMVSGANVFGINCTNSEITTSANFASQVLAPYLNWLNQNPTKHPQYLVLFMDISSRVEDGGTLFPSVQYQMSTNTPGIQPFVTSINMNGANGTNDCIAYINKLAFISTNYSSARLIISASAGEHGNTNYYFDDAQGIYPDYPFGFEALQGVTSNGVPLSAVDYDPFTNSIHITQATNVTGYLTWGENGGQDPGYATNGSVVFSGKSSWYVIETVESYNGQVVQDSPQGNFIQWFSSNAFGGTNYSNTPVGAVTHVEEPDAFYIENSQIYFGFWAGGKTFAICAWNSRRTPYFQAVGDPFTKK